MSTVPVVELVTPNLPEYGEYTADNISALKDAAHIRHRPGMYIGDTGPNGLHHLVFELVHNSIDEALAGFCKNIHVEIDVDGHVSVSDDGRGIPVEPHPELGRSTLEVVLTINFTSGKFDSRTYKMAVGLHGIGAKAVTALSEWVEAEVRRDGKLYVMEFERGKAVSDLVERGAATRSGTKISFWPDPDIFHDRNFDYDRLADHLRELAYLCAGVTIKLTDGRTGKGDTFHAVGGLAEFVEYMNAKEEKLHAPIAIDKTIPVEKVIAGETIVEDVRIQVALQFTTTEGERVRCYANNAHNSQGGTHLSGLRRALTTTMGNYGQREGLFKNVTPTSEDYRDGLAAVVSVYLPRPLFESQTKVKLTNPEIDAAVSGVVSEQLGKYLEENPKIAKVILGKVALAAEAREAARKAKQAIIERKKILGGGGLPGKLMDCTTRDREESELFLVEGQSAGGSAEGGRDRFFQAILPLRGKVLNVEKARPEKFLSNEEICNLISAIGVDIGEDADLEKLRYGKVVILSVAGDEPTLVAHESGGVEFVRIGEFIDDCVAGRRVAGRYRVASFDPVTHALRFRPLKAVIRHSHQEPMYRLTTRYHRSIKVTASHSVFVLVDGRVQVKKGSEVRPGDLLVAPRRLPRGPEGPTRVDLLELFYWSGLTKGLYACGEDVRRIAGERVLNRVGRRRVLWEEPRVSLDDRSWQRLVARRQRAGLTQTQVAAAVGVKQPITVSHWERGVHQPIQSHFQGYLDAVGWEGPIQYDLVPARIDERLAQDDTSRNARWREVSPYKKLDSFTAEEVERLGAEVRLAPQAHVDKAFDRYLPISRELCWFLGWFVAEGTLSAHQVNLNLGQKDERFVPQLRAAIAAVFGEVPRCCQDPREAGFRLYFHSVAAARLIRAWRMDGRAHEKRLPDVLFSLPESHQLAFLEGYFLGDGTTSRHCLSFSTCSRDLKDGLLYLLGQLGLVAGVSEIPVPNDPLALIQRKHISYQIHLCGKEQLLRAHSIWQQHSGAAVLEEYARSPWRKEQDFHSIGDDLIAIPVTSAEEIEPVGEYVYDFSVEGDENFVCGTGGLCAHNTDADVDGQHIRTLLLTFFYRQMGKLIEDGHIFVARPPLYKVTHKKQVRYISSAEEMVRELMDRGLEGTTLTVLPPANADGSPGTGETRTFAGADLAALVKVMAPLEDALQILERRGINLATYLPRAGERGLPPWRVQFAGREEWFHTPEEVDAYREAQEQRLGRELVVEDDTTPGNGHANGHMTINVHELHEVRGINRSRALDELRQRGLSAADLLPLPRIAGREPAVRFVLHNGEQKRVLPHLRDLVVEVRRLGERGLVITRFKGLGEMDAEELWDTTLDPARRTLLRVQLEDAIKADELFRTLMGEKVEPRRDFIQREALNAKDIDYHGA